MKLGAFVSLFFFDVLQHCDWRSIGGIYASLLLILYYFIGSLVPLDFVLWIRRELPPSMTISVPGETRPLLLLVTIQLQHHLSIRLLLLLRRI
nr:tobamovirus multiplication protein 1-like [Tanacetum cinerariifolium]